MPSPICTRCTRCNQLIPSKREARRHASTCSSFFPFLRLPREIRDVIYGYVIGHEIRLKRRKTDTATQPAAAIALLLGLSSQVRAEALDFLHFRKPRFVLTAECLPTFLETLPRLRPVVSSLEIHGLGIRQPHMHMAMDKRRIAALSDCVCLNLLQHVRQLSLCLWLTESFVSAFENRHWWAMEKQEVLHVLGSLGRFDDVSVRWSNWLEISRKASWTVAADGTQAFLLRKLQPTQEHALEE
jgi:hypothetical protein